MSIIEDALKRAGAEEVKAEDLRPGDKFVLLEEDNFYEDTVERVHEGRVSRVGASWSLFVYDEQRWYLVERAPVEEPTGWGAVVEVYGVKYSRVPDEPQDEYPWIRSAGGAGYDWEELASLSTPKVLFEGVNND